MAGISNLWKSQMICLLYLLATESFECSECFQDFCVVFTKSYDEIALKSDKVIDNPKEKLGVYWIWYIGKDYKDLRIWDKRPRPNEKPRQKEISV